MENYKLNPFSVKYHYENEYYRLHVTNRKFKGRIRKRLGNLQEDEAENIAFNLKYELGKHFNNGEVLKEEVESYIENFISMNVKFNASIFTYIAEFLESKSMSTNKKTRKSLTKSTLSGYRTALKYFEDYMRKKKLSTHPSMITDKVLDGYYTFINGSHNYKTKLHTKIKGFIKYVSEEKQINVDASYKKSVFTEEYDNQCPKENDIALTKEEVKKLILLREKLKSGEVKLEPNIHSTKIPVEVQLRHFNVKEENLIKSLDCILLMISTGMYHSDIMKSQLMFSTNGKTTHVRYRRAKNGSLCKAIPIQKDDIFIGKEIIEQYGISNNTNFPLNLSLTHFNRHLHRISELSGMSFKITNKMARKTFASILYFNRELPIHFVQILLGHKNVKDTTHYLRISDDDIADEIVRRMSMEN